MYFQKRGLDRGGECVGQGRCIRRGGLHGTFEAAANGGKTLKAKHASAAGEQVCGFGELVTDAGESVGLAQPTQQGVATIEMTCR